MFEQVEVNNERWFDLADLKNEIWIDIKGYEGKYKISNYGRIKSLERKVKQFNRFKECNKHIKEKILKNSYDKDGYLVISLNKNGKAKWSRVHQIMGYSFLKNDGSLVVNHKDLNKRNPRIDNLELCTDYQNKQHAKKNGSVRKGRNILDLKNKIIYDDYKDMMKKLNINYNQYNYIMYDKKEKQYIFINDKK